MNIEKLAKYLKEFTLDEIEMIAECDVSAELEKLIAQGKLSLENDIYKYQNFENEVEFAVFTNSKAENENITLKTVSEIFMKDYAVNFCKPNTIKTYTAILRTNVIPILGNKKSESLHRGYQEVLHDLQTARNGRKATEKFACAFEPDFKIL